MATFAYQAMDRSGQTLSGRLEAEAEATAAVRLKQMGYLVLEVKEVKESPFKAALQLGVGGVNARDLAVFTRQFAAMVAAGLPITRCLYTMSRQVENGGLRRALAAIAASVEKGTSLSEAFGAFPHIFSPLFVSMIRAGEAGGSLDEVLSSLARQLEADKSLRDNIRSATFYPLTVSIFAAVLLLGMLFFIVPIFVNMFSQFGAALPTPTRMLLAASTGLRQYWYVLVAIVVAVFFGLRAGLQTPGGTKLWDGLKLRLPVFGPLMHKTAIARFARTLSTLLAGGLPILQALEIAGSVTGNTVISGAISRAEEKIREGESIALPLETSGTFPPMVTQMIAVGEESGTLTALLQKVADFYEEEVAAMVKGIASLIEPLMIIVIGVVIGGIVISLYLPIFTLVTSVNY